jgi:hypothetical protein
MHTHASESVRRECVVRALHCRVVSVGVAVNSACSDSTWACELMFS